MASKYVELAVVDSNRRLGQPAEGPLDFVKQDPEVVGT